MRRFTRFFALRLGFLEVEATSQSSLLLLAFLGVAVTGTALLRLFSLPSGEGDGFELLAFEDVDEGGGASVRARFLAGEGVELLNELRAGAEGDGRLYRKKETICTSSSRTTHHAQNKKQSSFELQRFLNNANY